MNEQNNDKFYQRFGANLKKNRDREYYENDIYPGKIFNKIR